MLVPSLLLLDTEVLSIVLIWCVTLVAEEELLRVAGSVVVGRCLLFAFCSRQGCEHIVSSVTWYGELEPLN